MKKALPRIFALAPLLLSFQFLCADEIAGYSGTLSIELSAGTASNPSYKVVSAGIAPEPVLTGFVASVTSNTINFETSTDSDGNTVSPFIPNVFKNTIKVPFLKATRSGNSVNAVNIGNSGKGFTSGKPPEIVFDYPDGGDDVATAVATLNGTGGITSINLTHGGSGYGSDPTVTVIAGPHFVRLTEPNSPDVGRSFLILDNNATGLTVDISRLASGESLTGILKKHYSVEIIPVNTLGSMMGISQSDCPLEAGNRDAADLVYLWDYDKSMYISYYFFTGSSRYPAGWYNRSKMRAGHQNETIIYPDEGFIVARRTNSAASIELVGSVSDVNQKLRLPASGAQVVMNNPFGVDVLLGEIIPTKFLGTSSTDFRPSANDGNTTLADTIFFLSGSTWDQYYYKGGINDGVTQVATASAKLDSPGSGRALTNADVSLASGTITNLQSCTSNGTTSGVDHNTSEYTKVTISGTAPAAGFEITFGGIAGRSVSDTYNAAASAQYELDVEGSDIAAGSGIMVFSTLNGTFEVIASGSGYVVINQKRDVNFESGKGTKTWSTGSGGAGYNTNAKVYFVGGDGSGGEGTATVSSGAVTGISVTNGGSGYTSAPQVVIAGGGWRKVGAADAVQDSQSLAADDGMIIMRANPSGIMTYIEAINPNKKK
jgi:hypothetical protein